MGRSCNATSWKLTLEYDIDIVLWEKNNGKPFAMQELADAYKGPKLFSKTLLTQIYLCG
jgi:hypothetical protein